MTVLGLSLLLASVAYFIHRYPAWHPHLLLQWAGLASSPRRHDERKPPPDCLDGPAPHSAPASPCLLASDDAPPPDSPTTPKATPVVASPPIPTFHLHDTSSCAAATPPSPASMMPPPPLPSSSRTPPRLPTLSQFPAANSPQRARAPVTNRSPQSSRLQPPSALSPQPKRASRKVMLEPGRSPLDWARISGPAADLRGLPAATPYLRIPPSLLRKYNGRKGADAWMAISGRVYNISPYAEYHPGGVPELMRGAGRDATKLFADIHPWVNYESMLSACLVGLLVDEPLNGVSSSEMDQLD